MDNELIQIKEAFRRLDPKHNSGAEFAVISMESYKLYKRMTNYIMKQTDAPVEPKE